MATVRIQLRRGTASQWDTANPTLAAGEIGIETDTNTFKFGDGTTAWNDLSYALSDTVDDYILLSTKGQPLGVASLDASGYVPAAQLPPLAKVTVNAVADQAARLALTVEPGDIAIQSDNGTTYVLQSSPASNNANWKEISATAAISAAVSAHESDTTNVHGISDTSILVTTTGTQTLTNKTITSPLGLVKSDVGLGNVDNTSDADKPISTSTQSALDLKAPLASPALTGVPTAPTATAYTNSTQIATTAYTDAAVNSLASTVASDYATKVEVEAAVNGIDIKEAVKASTTSAITLSGTQTVDGVSLLVGDRVLVKNQADAKTNGVYVVSSGSWTRALDFDETSEVKEGSFVFVVEGTANASHGFVLTSEGSGAGESIIFGTDSLNFTQFTGAVPILTGNGILKNDNTLSVDTSYVVPVSTYNTDKSGIDASLVTLDSRLDSLEPRVGVTETDIGNLQTSTSSLDNLKAPKESPTFTGTVVLPSTTSIGNVSATEIEYLNGSTGNIQTQITDLSNLKANIANPTFTGTFTSPLSTAGYVKTDSSGVLSSSATVDQSDIVDLVSDLALKAPLDAPTFTGNVVLPSTTIIGSVDATELSYVNGVTSAIQTQIDSKAPSNDPTFTGSVSLPSTTSIGNVDGTEIGHLNGVTSGIQSQIDSKAPSNDPTFTGSVSLPSTTSIGNVDGTEIGYLNGVTSGVQSQIDSKSPIASPTFTGTVVLPSTTSIGDVSSTEIGYLNGSTSNIQTQIDTKASNTDLSNHASDTTGIHGIADTSLLVTTTGTQTITNKTLTSPKINEDVALTATATELNYVDGVTSAIQTQLDSKASSTDLSTHASDTTSIHGISDTAQLAYLNAASQTFTGNMEVDGNMTVDGNLTVNGTTFNASATSITIEDNLVQLAHQNAANTVDLGLVVAYNDGAAKHAGIVRDVSADKWKLFKGVTSEPATTVDFTQGSLDDLQVNNLDAVAITATGAITASASGVVFTDGTQTKEGVPSRTPIIQKSAAYTLGALTERDSMIEVSHTGGTAIQITVPADSTLNFPIGTSIDILRTNTGAVIVDGAVGCTVNATPGKYLRAQWSSATLFKRAANTWVLMGDLANA